MTVLEIAAGGLGLALLLEPLGAMIPIILRYLWEACLNFVVTRHTFQNDAQTSMVLKDLLTNAEVIWEGHSATQPGLEIFSRYIIPLKKRRAIWCEWVENHWKILKYRGAYMLYQPVHAGTEGVDRGMHARLTFRRGAVDMKRLLRDSEESYAEKNITDNTRRFKIVDIYAVGSGSYNIPSFGNNTSAPNLPSHDPKPSVAMTQPVTWSVEDIGVDVEASETEDLATNPAMEEVFRAARFWFRRQAWYREVGLPHRIGIGAFGAPGTGKTSAIRAIASELDLPIYRFHLAGMTDETFSARWEQCRNNEPGPHVILFEDFDTIFDLREPAKGVTLTYSEFLNVIDGVERDEGVLLYVTANHPEKIDPALGVMTKEKTSSRPGRLSVVVEFPNTLDEAGRRKIAERIMRAEDPEVIKATIEVGINDSPDQFTHRCIGKMREFIMNTFDAGATE